MHEHNEIRTLLTLAAAGALEMSQQMQVEEHLSSCAACREELAALRAIAGGLRELPPPQPRLGLAAQTRARVIAELETRAERRHQHLLLGLSICLAWVATLVTFALVRYFGDDLARLTRLSFVQVEFGFITYTLIAGLATAVFAGLVGRRHHIERRTI